MGDLREAMVASQEIRVADLPGMRAFLDAVAALLDTINTADVPPEVMAAADRVRAEALGIGQDPVVTAEDNRSPAQVSNEGHLRTAMLIARENPLRPVTVDWLHED